MLKERISGVKLIVGLGNPGLIYENTRHNLGSWFVKAIAKKYKVRLRLSRYLRSRIARLIICGQECILAIPDMFMNLSGEAIGSIVDHENIAAKNLLVIHDDIELPLGEFRLQVGGSAKGHKGVRSVHDALGTQDIARLRLGVGRPPEGMEGKAYVLGRFDDSDQPAVQLMVRDVKELLSRVAAEGIVAAIG